MPPECCCLLSALLVLDVPPFAVPGGSWSVPSGIDHNFQAASAPADARSFPEGEKRTVATALVWPVQVACR